MFRKALLNSVVFGSVFAIPALSAEAQDRRFPELKIGNENTYLQLYGQFNPALLFADDGQDTDTYFVDNSNASTRFGLRFDTTFENGVTFGANYEAQYDPFSSSYVNQDNGGDPDWERYLTRKAEVYTGGPAGKFWAGQGAMASDGTAEVDLSGTGVIGYSSVADMAGGQLFRFKDGDLSGVHVGDAFRNYDGLSRKLRVRYDTPSLAGFSLSASWGREVIPEENGPNVWDAALRYAGEFGAFRVAAAGAIADKDNGIYRYSSSASVLHTPTGISVTGAVAYDERDGGDDGSYVYGKLGYEWDFIAAGSTAISVDAYSGNDVLVPGSQSTSWGIQAVQDLEYCNAQLYAGYREYKLSDKFAKYDTIRAGMTGMLVKF